MFRRSIPRGSESQPVEWGDKSRRASTKRILRKVMHAAARSGEPSGYIGSVAAIRDARAQSSVRVRRISSLIVNACIVSFIVFRPRQSRPSDGSPATKEAAASLATETKRTSALALAAMSRRTVRNGLKKDGSGVAEMGKRVLTIQQDARKMGL